MSLERPTAPDPYDLLPSKPSFTLESDEVTDGEKMDASFVAPWPAARTTIRRTCAGRASRRRPRASSVTCFDPDAPTHSGFWHWVLVNLPASTTELASGAGSGGELPEGAFHVRNDYGEKAWGGAAPPEGDPPHRYVFAVHALDVEKLERHRGRLAGVRRLQPGLPHAGARRDPAAVRRLILWRRRRLDRRGGAGAAALVAFVAVPAYSAFDSIYSLVWGQDILRGRQADLRRLPRADPAPAVGRALDLLAPLGRGRQPARSSASASPGFVALVVRRLPLRRGGLRRAVGWVFALLLLSRLDYGFLAARGYIDVPFLALVVWAAALEAEEPRAAARSGRCWPRPGCCARRRGC